VFNKQDKVVIRSLYELKGYNARKFMLEFSDKGWKKCSINRLLQKLRNDGTVTPATWSSTSSTRGQAYHKTHCWSCWSMEKVVKCTRDGEETSLWTFPEPNRLFFRATNTRLSTE